MRPEVATGFRNSLTEAIKSAPDKTDRRVFLQAVKADYPEYAEAKALHVEEMQRIRYIRSELILQETPRTIILGGVPIQFSAKDNSGQWLLFSALVKNLRVGVEEDYLLSKYKGYTNISAALRYTCNRIRTTLGRLLPPGEREINIFEKYTNPQGSKSLRCSLPHLEKLMNTLHNQRREHPEYFFHLVYPFDPLSPSDAFPQELRNARLAAGLSQDELAKLARVVNYQNIRSYEKGISRPTPRIINQLVEALPELKAEMISRVENYSSHYGF